MTPKSFGQRIKSIRETMKGAKGKTLSVYELADRVGVGRAYLGKVENKGSKRPGAEFVQNLAAALGVTEKWLRTGTGPKYPPEKIDSPELRDEPKPQSERYPLRARALAPWRQAIQAVSTMQFEGAAELTEADWVAHIEETIQSFRRGHNNDIRKKRGARILREEDD